MKKCKLRKYKACCVGGLGPPGHCNGGEVDCPHPPRQAATVEGSADGSPAPRHVTVLIGSKTTKTYPHHNENLIRIQHFQSGFGSGYCGWFKMSKSLIGNCFSHEKNILKNLNMMIF